MIVVNKSFCKKTKEISVAYQKSVSLAKHDGTHTCNLVFGNRDRRIQQPKAAFPTEKFQDQLELCGCGTCLKNNHKEHLPLPYLKKLECC